MDNRCEVCDAPLEAPGFSKCPTCLIEEMAEGARIRLENEPWERLPERWKRIAEGWSDFPEEFRAELRTFLVAVYDLNRNEKSRSSTLLRRRPRGRHLLDDPSERLDRIEAELEEWSA